MVTLIRRLLAAAGIYIEWGRAPRFFVLTVVFGPPSLRRVIGLRL